jgi:hypothetical protein
MNVNLYVIKEYENETAFRLEQNKPNQTQSPSAIRNTQYEIRDTRYKPNQTQFLTGQGEFKINA